jgi:predicted RNA binding protein YcfA (HicA-like mRNA interferase family)
MPADGFSSQRRGATDSSSTAPQVVRVTVPGKPGDDLAPGTLNSILKQAGLKK